MSEWDLAGQWVHHKPTGVVDEVAAVHEPPWTSKDGDVIRDRVVETKRGHTLVARDRASFVVLDASARGYRDDVMGLVRLMLESSMRIAAGKRVPIDTALIICSDVLRDAMHKLTELEDAANG